MKFAFSRKYKFKCKNCGACCKPGALALTYAEYERFAKIVDQSHYENMRQFHLTPTIGMHEISFKGEDCTFLTDRQGRKLCGTYGSRFIMCRLFPLAISALPDGELLVNLVHCNGVSLENGETVDERFVEELFDDLSDVNHSFVAELVSGRKGYHENLFCFYTRIESTDFWTKRRFLDKISQWLVGDSMKDKPVDVRIRAIGEFLSTYLNRELQKLFDESGLLQPPLILSDKDVEGITNRLERAFETNIVSICDNVEIQIRTLMLEALMRKKGEIEIEGKSKVVGLDEKITWLTPYLDKIEIRFVDLLREKSFSNEAVLLLEEYSTEVLSRIDQGGFDMNVPMNVIMESLFRLFRGILTYAKAYSTKSDNIQEHHVNDAIVYFDTRYVLGPIMTRVLQEYSHEWTV